MNEEKVEEKKEEEKKDQNINRGLAVASYFVFFLPLFTDSKDDPFVKFHMKQSLLLFIAAVITMFLGIIPLFGWILAAVAPIFLVISWIIGIINAANGKTKPVPVIGKYAENILNF